MNDDLISRSALIAEIQNRKVTTGDPVIRLIFDRLIDIVKGQPAVEDPVPSRMELTPFGLVFYYEDGRKAEVRSIQNVDAVEVVRCKDCTRYQIDTLFGMGYCNGLDKKPDDFCSYGERCNNEQLPETTE